MADNRPQATNNLVDELKRLNVTRGILVQMARAGQLYEIRCEMPSCYCPEGRRKFDKKADRMPDWGLNADHYPTLKMDGGTLTPGNVRLAHVLCNRVDYAWRKRIREMLEKKMSLEEIAAILNRSKRMRAPHGTNCWSAATVRKAFVS